MTVDTFSLNDETERWLALFIPGDNAPPKWFHFYRSGEKRSTCGNHARPFMALSPGKDTPREQACPRCVEAFTFAGNPAPEFP